MADRPLIPCEACQRHVRDEDSTCAFCGAARTPGAARPKWVQFAEAFEREDQRHRVPAYGAPPLRRPGVWLTVLFLMLNAAGLMWLLFRR